MNINTIFDGEFIHLSVDDRENEQTADLKLTNDEALELAGELLRAVGLGTQGDLTTKVVELKRMIRRIVADYDDASKLTESEYVAMLNDARKMVTP